MTRWISQKNDHFNFRVRGNDSNCSYHMSEQNQLDKLPEQSILKNVYDFFMTVYLSHVLSKGERTPKSLESVQAGCVRLGQAAPGCSPPGRKDEGCGLCPKMAPQDCLGAGARRPPASAQRPTECECILRGEANDMAVRHPKWRHNFSDSPLDLDWKCQQK